MPQRTYTNFAGGVNKQLGPVVLDMGDGEALAFAEEATNWELSEKGLIKYPGYDNVLTSPLSGSPTITGIFEFRSAVSGLLELIVCAGTKIYTVSGGTATEIKTGQTAGAYYQSQEWDNGAGTRIIVLDNGTDTPVAYDGTTCAAITYSDPETIWNSAKPQGSASFRGSLLYWGDPTYKFRVYKPRPGSHNNFNNNENTVEAFDVPASGGALTGAKTLTDDFCVLYQEKAIRRLAGSAPFGTGPDQYELREVTESFGCIAPRTIVGNDVEHYFLSDDGLRQLKPIENYGDIDPTQPTYLVQSLVNELNFTQSAIKNACAVFDKTNKQIWLAVPDGSSNTNNKVFVYDVITKGVDFRATGDMAVSCFGTFNRKVYHGDYAGQVYKHGDNNSNDGTAITATWQSKYIAHNGIGAFKCYRKLIIYADADGAGDVIVQWSILKDGQPVTESSTETIATGSSAWDSALWDTALWSVGEQNVFHIKNLGRGNAIALKFINTSDSQRVKIRQVDLFYDIFGTVKG